MRKLQDHLRNRTLDEIKSQWHKLKTIFDREDKRVEGSKRSGAGTDSVYFPTWKYFKLFMFTKSCNDLDDSRSSLSISTDEESTSTCIPSKKKLKKDKCGKNQELESLKVELWKEALSALKGKEDENKLDGLGNEMHSFCVMVHCQDLITSKEP